MENPLENLGSKHLIKKHEFVRIIIQCLYSLGYRKSAVSLESESGIAYKSDELESLESHILDANWDACIDCLNRLNGLTNETRASALFLVLKQCLLEYLNRGDDSSALEILQKQISGLQVEKEKVHKLAFGFLSLKELGLGKVDLDVIFNLRNCLLMELEKVLPPPITLPERRLEYLVEMAVWSKIDNCVYHNSVDAVSLYEDHHCDGSQFPTKTTQILTNHRNEVWYVQFSNNGNYLASSSSDCTAIIWKVLDDGNLTQRHVLQSHKKPVSFVAWSPDDTMLLTCGNMEVLKLWDVETDPEKGIYMWDCEGKEIKSWRGLRMPKVLDLAVTPDGEKLISIFSDKDIRILNVGTGAERVIPEEHPITSLSLSGDGKFFIVNLNSQEIHMWDVAGEWFSPMKYKSHRQHKYVIRSCFGGLDSTFIASGSEDSKVYIWNRRGSKPIEILCGHTMTVNCVSWNPKRPHMLASASDDQTIRIWGPNVQSRH
ncbi:WD repeat-containing protein WDS homolog isoform X2 [Nicotiana tomentosiformis]|uniref:WD repeat-containing protein WDS homolog isoform X2 n=1 Tax=Nicotiana tomentosiformis TaxID=4098 RepID=UPI00051B06E1|nr:WD repeat-containing protein WDS homolog isoform X2 [Nicotiana tomentosiformis]